MKWLDDLIITFMESIEKLKDKSLIKDLFETIDRFIGGIIDMDHDQYTQQNGNLAGNRQNEYSKKNYDDFSINHQSEQERKKGMDIGACDQTRNDNNDEKNGDNKNTSDGSTVKTSISGNEDSAENEERNKIAISILDIKSLIKTELEKMATKDSVDTVEKNIKAELEKMATKDSADTVEKNIKAELEKMATKDGVDAVEKNIKAELEKMATKDSVDAVEKTIKTELKNVVTREEFKSLEGSIKQSDSKIDNILSVIISIKAEVEKMNSSIEAKDNEINALNQTIHEKEVEKDKALKELEAKMTKLNDDKIHEIEGKNRLAIEKMEQDFETEKTALLNRIEELEAKNKELNIEMQQGKDAEEKQNRPFVNLLEKIVKCESMNEFSDNKKLNDIYSSYSESPERIRDFISLVGNEYGFALDICNALKKFKKASADPKPITQEEKELIEEINKFYREREGRDQNEELLYLPKGFTYSNVSGAQIPFYEPEMQDLKDAMQNRFEYISDVYTPCFKKYGTMNPQIKATVKGRIKG